MQTNSLHYLVLAALKNGFPRQPRLRHRTKEAFADVDEFISQGDDEKRRADIFTLWTYVDRLLSFNRKCRDPAVLDLGSTAINVIVAARGMTTSWLRTTQRFSSDYMALAFQD